MRQVERGRIEFVRLPTYAPEFDPVEGIWSLLKGYYLRNFGCHDLAQLKNLLIRAVAALSSKPERVKACFGQAGY